MIEYGLLQGGGTLQHEKLQRLPAGWGHPAAHELDLLSGEGT